MKKIAKEHSEEKTPRIQRFLKIITVLGFLGNIYVIGYLYFHGYLTNTDKLQLIVKDAGVLGPLLFIILQIIHVVFPILPGGMLTIAGIFLFGNSWGFIWNYIGICIGSMISFLIAKKFGRSILRLFFSPKMIAAYEQRTNEESHFVKFFTWAIFSPIAPDDFLCYLAGTTTMSYKRFMLTILVGKPIPLFIYSVGLSHLLSTFSGMF